MSSGLIDCYNLGATGKLLSARLSWHLHLYGMQGQSKRNVTSLLIAYNPLTFWKNVVSLEWVICKSSPSLGTTLFVWSFSVGEATIHLISINSQCSSALPFSNKSGSGQHSTAEGSYWPHDLAHCALCHKQGICSFNNCNFTTAVSQTGKRDKGVERTLENTIGRERTETSVNDVIVKDTEWKRTDRGRRSQKALAVLSIKYRNQWRLFVLLCP